MASSSKKKQSIWGNYSILKNNARKDGKTQEYATELHDKYALKLGLTSFNSSQKEHPVEERLPTGEDPADKDLLNWSEEYKNL